MINILPVVVAAAMLAAIIVMNAVDHRHDRDGEWHLHTPFLRAPNMRRYIKGEWEHRELIESESLDHESRDAW